MRTSFAPAVAIVLALASSAPGQSLGGLAAQEKARREREKKAKPTKVYTDQDLEIEAARAGPRSETPAPPAGSSEPAEGAPVPAIESGSEPNDSVQGRLAEAQASLASARQSASAADAEVERLKQDLNPMSTTFKTDPYEILQLQAALTQAQAQAAEAQKQVAVAEAAMEVVKDEARRAGVRVP